MRKLGLTARVVMAGGILLLLVAGAFVLMLVAIGNLRQTSDEVHLADGRIALATQVERRVIDLETGARGFLITQQARFLQPRNQALKVLPELHRQLLSQARLSGDHQQVVRLTAIFQRLNSYIVDYSNPLLATAKRNVEAARRIVTAGEGKRRVDEMRRMFSSYLEKETANAEQKRDAAGASASHAILFGVLGLLGVPLLIAIFTLLESRTVAAPVRRISKAAEKLRAGDLAVRVEEDGAGEVRTLAESFNAMAASLQQSRDELETQNAELEAQQGELERTVEELAEEHDRIQRFHDFVSRLAAEPDLDRLGTALLDELSAVAGADAATLYAIEAPGPGGEEGRLRLVASHGFDRGMLETAFERGHGLAGRAVLEERIVKADHGETGLELLAFGQSVRVQHELHLPIGRPGRMIGVVSLAKLGEHGFSQALGERLAQMADPAAVALANALSLEVAEQVAAWNQTVLETAHDAFIATDEDGVTLAWNSKAEELFGYSSDEALGKVAAELVFPDAANQQASSDRRAALLEGRPLKYEVWATCRGGRRILVEASATGMQAGDRLQVNYFVRDVTGRARREQEGATREAVSRALAQSETEADMAERILAAIGSGMGWPIGAYWQPDEQGRGLYCTHIWSSEDFDAGELERLSREQAYEIGQPAPELALALQAWEGGELRWAAREHPTAVSEQVAATAPAGLRSALAMPVLGSAGPLGVLEFGLREDQAPNKIRIQVLRSITDLIGQVMERRSAEQEADRMKDEFFALVSHELRTPLTSITGYLDIVREEEAGEINEEQRHFLGVIDRNARRLMRLVSDLLFVAQVEAGSLSLKTGRVDLEKVASEAVEAARPRAEKQGVLLAAETEPITMEAGDGDRLGQVVDNLVSNAIKFTPEGGSVTVRLRSNGDRALLEVSDTGMGISSDDQERLFDRFYRTDDAGKLAIPGIGLGLSIVKAIAEGHAGMITVESKEGHGTTFRVELPLGATGHSSDNGSATRIEKAAKR